MATRAILLPALAAFLVTGMVHADDVQNLTGSILKTEDAVSRSDAVFVGEMTDMGTETALPVTVMYAGTAYKGFKIKVLQVVMGSVGAQTSVTLIVDVARGEMMPAVGRSYIFFVWKNDDSGDPFFAGKLLIATHGNIASIKKLIAQRPKN